MITNDYISISKELYNALNTLVSYNKNAQLMIVGAKVNGNNVVIDPKSLIWFEKEQLKVKENGDVDVEPSLLIDSLIEVTKKGNDAVILLHSHPNKDNSNDFLFGSLTEGDLANSKQLYLLCDFKNLKLYDGIITGNHIYFWTIDNEFLKPIQVGCYVDGEKVTSKVPSTIDELTDAIFS